MTRLNVAQSSLLTLFIRLTEDLLIPNSLVTFAEEPKVFERFFKHPEKNK